MKMVDGGFKCASLRAYDAHPLKLELTSLGSGKSFFKLEMDGRSLVHGATRFCILKIGIQVCVPLIQRRSSMPSSIIGLWQNFLCKGGDLHRPEEGIILFSQDWTDSLFQWTGLGGKLLGFNSEVIDRR